MASIFGFEIKRKTPQIQSVVSPNQNDGSLVTQDLFGIGNQAYAYNASVLDLEGNVKSEDELIKRYRETSQYPDCDSAIEDIVNEAIISEDNTSSVRLNLDELEVNDKIKEIITEEFDNILELLQFSERGHDLFRQWYVDGRAYIHIILDETVENDSPSNKEGILELRPIDARKIRKIKNIRKDKNEHGVDMVVKVEEYFVYNDKGFSDNTDTGVKLSVDSVAYAPSGLMDQNSGLILGYLHKAIKPTNQLKMIEDALVIYRLSRAPERRIFYIDVGNMPKLKAEQYVQEIMTKYKNKLVYDVTTGEVKDSRKNLSMLEDFWMPRRDGGKGTEITTLKGGENLSNIEDIHYFQNKLYQALNVPMSRMDDDSGFNVGKSSEITRDEVKFSKFIGRLRKKYSQILASILRVQLISKGIMTPEDWDELNQKIRYDFIKDNFYAELKNNEIMQQRMALTQLVDPFVGKYFSQKWLRKNILQQTDEDMAKIDKEILAEPVPAMTVEPGPDTGQPTTFQ